MALTKVARFFMHPSILSPLGNVIVCPPEIKLICRYRNYPPEQLVDIVARILALVPPWTRVYRVQRDIPMPLVTSGVEKGNLRELALARMDDLGLKCRDVRTREAGIQVSNIDYLQIYVIEHCYFLYSSSNIFPILHYI